MRGAFLLNFALLSLTSLSTEGLDSLLGHWGHQHPLSPLPLRGLAALAQGCDIFCQLFVAHWMLSPELMVTQIPLPKILFNPFPIVIISYDLSVFWFLVPVSLHFLFSPDNKFSKDILAVCRDHPDLQDGTAERGKNISDLKNLSIDVPSSQLPTDSLAWTYFSTLNLKIICNTWKQEIHCATWSKFLQCHVWNQYFSLHF